MTDITAVSTRASSQKVSTSDYNIQRQPEMAIYSVRQKKYPLNFIAIFSATARNFYMKFHTVITDSLSHKIAK